MPSIEKFQIKWKAFFVVFVVLDLQYILNRLPWNLKKFGFIKNFNAIKNEKIFTKLNNWYDYLNEYFVQNIENGKSKTPKKSLFCLP